MKERVQNWDEIEWMNEMEREGGRESKRDREGEGRGEIDRVQMSVCGPKTLV